jgi:sugar O-acyltransferase (sialic acid O-acetyltransferase NeuD family)
MKKLIVVGDSLFAEIAYEYFTHDSEYEVVAFAVESDHLNRDSLFELPVVPFETLEQSFDPAEHHVYAALVYTQLNRLRTRLSAEAKRKGFPLASYVSSRAFVWRNVELGEHCFIFEDNTVQPFVRVGDNVVMWSGNHIGHHATIRDNCFIASHVAIAGSVDVGENCFLGINSAFVNDITVGRDCWIGPGIPVTRDVPPESFLKPARFEPSGSNPLEFFGVEAEVEAEA